MANDYVQIQTITVLYCIHGQQIYPHEARSLNMS